MGERGPRPAQLSRLFKLEYSEGIRDAGKVAGILGVSKKTVYHYRWKLRKRLEKLAKNSLQVSDSETVVCPECLEPTLIEDCETGEWVCRRCGLVTRQTENFSRNLPFDTTYAFTSNIVFGRSLGGTAPNHLYKVLAKAPAERKDLPIRSRQIKIIQNAVDPPVVKRMLNYGSNMLKDLGMHQDTEKHHLLAHRCGSLLREIAAFLQISKLNVQSYLVTRAAVYYLLKQLKPDKAEEARLRFPFKPRYLCMVEKLVELKREATGSREIED
jgi:ribosomal protein L37AE/L43A